MTSCAACKTSQDYEAWVWCMLPAVLPSLHCRGGLHRGRRWSAWMGIPVHWCLAGKDWAGQPCHTVNSTRTRKSGIPDRLFYTPKPSFLCMLGIAFLVVLVSLVPTIAAADGLTKVQRTCWIYVLNYSTVVQPLCWKVFLCGHQQEISLHRVAKALGITETETCTVYRDIYARKLLEFEVFSKREHAK